MNPWLSAPGDDEPGGRLRVLQYARGRRNRWRSIEDTGACLGGAISLAAWKGLGVARQCIHWRFQRIERNRWRPLGSECGDTAHR